MHVIVVAFDIPPERREHFIAAALKDARDSLANEPGTKRFELIVDNEDPNRFYLDEAYEDDAALEAHANGPYVAEFRDAISDYVSEFNFIVRGQLHAAS